MGEVIPIGAADSVRRGYRYAVYEHRLVTTDGLAYTRSFIVLKNRYGGVHEQMELIRAIGMKPYAIEELVRVNQAALLRARETIGSVISHKETLADSKPRQGYRLPGLHEPEDCHWRE